MGETYVIVTIVLRYTSVRFTLISLFRESKVLDLLRAMGWVL